MAQNCRIGRRVHYFGPEWFKPIEVLFNPVKILNDPW